ncbi:N-6 DNA methylase [Kocuria rosea]|uniref:N-6 DNA methylase n=1 Tax=Kocuria rosea TaxID=1275 RepID=UPI002B24CD18|nr:N-6 DNA methylase [Kocuria rosea]MEB2620049.1 N-6 DNA methylase [Kocuria rosea]
METLTDLTARIAHRDPARAEATLQADIRSFILMAGLNLHAEQIANDPDPVSLESQLRDGTGRRIDIEAGTTVIEVKRNLAQGNTLVAAEEQLGAYIRHRVNTTGARYLGVLTDGAQWRLYVPATNDTGPIIAAGSPLHISGAGDTEKLRHWLGTILATDTALAPTPENIASRLGATSPAHEADHTTLNALYVAGRDHPTVQIKRELWTKLLRTAFGEAFADADHLFIDHTLLVLTAEAIAHAVLGFDISRNGPITPRALADGEHFREAQILGVVEADFFDWPLELPGGEQFVKSLADRISRFDWSNVQHDVLKHLYESVISQQTREALGEYYTPDWLADRMIHHADTEPLSTTVMDVSAGSGTFLFHAVRSYLKAAEDTSVPTGEAVHGVVRHVFGMDIHPVAATLARVTYLLAIGRDRLNAPGRGPINIPVYLGDALQWEQGSSLLAREDVITVPTTGDDILTGAGGGVLFGDDLLFPHSVLTDAQRFDQLVSEMADRVLTAVPHHQSANQRHSAGRLVDPLLRRYSVPEQDWPVLRETFDTMRRLNDSGRNHIWGYYVRNLIRPLYFSLPEHRVDLLVGNPPWLRYSKMGTSMQARYKRLAKARNLLSGALGASGRDLSTLFVTRAVELYLKPGGRFSYVMPHGTLSRKPHHGFRGGRWMLGQGAETGLAVQFDESWDLRHAPTGFPMSSCVIHGTRHDNEDRAMSSIVQNWHGRFSNSAHTWTEVAEKFEITQATVTQHDPNDPAPVSPYAKAFRQGAIIVPRMLVCVEELAAGPLGAGAGRVRVTSRRGSLDKAPWKNLPSIEAVVGREYLFPLLLGETVAPYRVLKPLTTVLPIHERTLLAPEVVHEHLNLASWWSQAEEAWEANQVASETKPLAGRIDYHGQLTAQLGREYDYRVVYTKSGNRIASSVIRDTQAIIDHKLYWAPANTENEARYLTAILNSAALLERVKPLQTLGLFGARDFDKYVFKIPFRRYDNNDNAHVRIATLAGQAESVAAEVDVSEARRFQDARKAVDLALKNAGLEEQLEAAVKAVLPSVDVASLE